MTTSFLSSCRSNSFTRLMLTSSCFSRGAKRPLRVSRAMVISLRSFRRPSIVASRFEICFSSSLTRLARPSSCFSRYSRRSFRVSRAAVMSASSLRRSSMVESRLTTCFSSSLTRLVRSASCFSRDSRRSLTVSRAMVISSSSLRSASIVSPSERTVLVVVSAWSTASFFMDFPKSFETVRKRLWRLCTRTPAQSDAQRDSIILCFESRSWSRRLAFSSSNS